MKRTFSSSIARRRVTRTVPKTFSCGKLFFSNFCRAFQGNHQSLVFRTNSQREQRERLRNNYLFGAFLQSMFSTEPSPPDGKYRRYWWTPLLIIQIEEIVLAL